MPSVRTKMTRGSGRAPDARLQRTPAPGKTPPAKKTTTAVPAPQRTFPAGSPPPGKAMLATDTGLKLVLPFAPREVDHDGWSDKWDVIERPGRRALVRHSATGLPTMSFDLLLARPDHQQSVEDIVAKLKAMAVGDARVIVQGLGVNEAGPWHLTGLKVKTQMRQAKTNAITRATASCEFTLAVDITVAGVRRPPAKKGPASGGSQRTPPKAPKGVTTPKTYVVRKGDTLQRISDQFYGTPDGWRRIADANRKLVRDPHWIKPGMKLTIPAGQTAAKVPAAAARTAVPTRASA